MREVFLDALVDTLKMVPLLLIVYAGIELLEFRWGSEVRSRIRHAGKAGPALGSVFGAVPQCGFSVITSSLYTQRAVSMGTLLAVYLSTSDEAIPVILAHPGKTGLVFPLLATKVLIGLVAGYAVDLLRGQSMSPEAAREVSVTAEADAGELRHGGRTDETAGEHGCCSHTVEKPPLRELLRHPIQHTATVTAFLFLVSLVINFVVFRFGQENLSRLFLSHSLWQPLAVTVIGLIPNCAVSVAITEAYLKGALSFGSTIAGLSAGGGLGVLVLLRENRDTRDTLTVLVLLLGVSALVGTSIQLLFG